MRKMQLWSTIKEIGQVIDGWDQEIFEKEIQKPEITFVKYLPDNDGWRNMKRYVIKIKINEEYIDEEDKRTNESSQCSEKS